MDWPIFVEVGMYIKMEDSPCLYFYHNINLTNSMELRASWEAASRSATKKISIL
jgi:hypothetical protein